MNKYLIPLVWSSLRVITITAMTTAATPAELVLLDTTPRYEQRWGESSFTLYRIHRSTSKHQLKPPVVKREDLGHIILRKMSDGSAILIGPFPTSQHNNQLLITIALQKARELGFDTIHTSPLHAREKPENAARIFGTQGFIFDPRHLVYRFTQATG